MTDLGELKNWLKATIHPWRCATEIIETSSLPTAKTCDIALRCLLLPWPFLFITSHPSPPFLLLFGQAFIVVWWNPKFLDQNRQSSNKTIVTTFTAAIEHFGCYYDHSTWTIVPPHDWLDNSWYLLYAPWQLECMSRSLEVAPFLKLIWSDLSYQIMYQIIRTEVNNGGMYDAVSYIRSYWRTHDTQ